MWRGSNHKLYYITDVTQWVEKTYAPPFHYITSNPRMKLAQYGDLMRYLSRIPYLHTGYDNNRLPFDNLKLPKKLDKKLFEFDAPEGTDIFKG
jgi:hypothetical protein